MSLVGRNWTISYHSPERHATSFRLQGLFHFTGIHEFLPQNTVLNPISIAVCKHELFTSRLCVALIFSIVGKSTQMERVRAFLVITLATTILTQFCPLHNVFPKHPFQYYPTISTSLRNVSPSKFCVSEQQAQYWSHGYFCCNTFCLHTLCLHTFLSAHFSVCTPFCLHTFLSAHPLSAHLSVCTPLRLHTFLSAHTLSVSHTHSNAILILILRLSRI